MKTDKPATNQQFNNIISRHDIDSRDTESLIELQQCATDACKAARHEESCSDDEVNWGDFICTGAELYISTERAGLRVVLEEADPDCSSVQEFVAEYLAKRGWPNVEVITEW